MDAITFENLLNESESNSLDFKQEQYLFEGSTEFEKSEILKDILAFANAWRRTDAYIIIGAKEVKGGRSQILGISSHFDDASLQQFVNSKVQKPIDFCYIPFEFEGKKVGVFYIPVQERPFFSKQDYGKVKKNVVYLRRGSSTDEANPDEIAKMGAATISTNNNHLPMIDCEFANPITHETYGKEIEIRSKVLVMKNDLPAFLPRSESFGLASMSSKPNRKYYQELFHFSYLQNLVKAFTLRLINTGSVTAYNARVEISIAEEDLLLLGQSDFPDPPRKYFNFLYPLSETKIIPASSMNSSLGIERKGAGWLLSIKFGNVQPKAEGWLVEPILVGCRKTKEIHFDAVIFADNAPNPIHVPMSIGFTVENINKELREIEKEYEDILDKEVKRLYPDDE